MSKYSKSFGLRGLEPITVPTIGLAPIGTLTPTTTLVATTPIGISTKPKSQFWEKVGNALVSSIPRKEQPNTNIENYQPPTPQLEKKDNTLKYVAIGVGALAVISLAVLVITKNNGK